jgi:hypothetical protein
LLQHHPIRSHSSISEFLPYFDLPTGCSG